MFARVSVLFVVALTIAACSGAEGREADICGVDADCASGFCAGICREPGGDDDGDGVDNRTERARGSDLDRTDSDGDGLSDGVEGDGDQDGDGALDAVESALVDADDDCLPEQLDTNERVPERDAATLARALCRRDGVCAAGGVEARCERIDIEGQVLAHIVCDYQAVVGFDGLVEGMCDGRDNDCDGETDEDLGLVDGAGVVRALGEMCFGTGACADVEGMVGCDATGTPRCSANGGSDEVPARDDDLDCDGIDNDCDGQTDEHVSWVDPLSGDVKPYGAPCAGLGACGVGLGVVECDAARTRGVCSLEPGGSADASHDETCDGRDDDCDGQTDEGIVWLDEAGRPRALGEACGVGACAGGVVVCGAASDPTARCSSAGEASAEACNGQDDDCDGMTDERQDLGAACPATGVCAELTLADVDCVDDGGGAFRLVCTFDDMVRYEAGGETRCNGEDDDCDGDTDEALVPAGGEPLGEPCSGIGACASVVGAVVCDADGVGTQCSANVTNYDEICNGEDDDCDGDTDKELTDTPPPCASAGVCTDYSELPALCEATGWVCPYVDDPAYEADEVTCDALDNDCDGEVDDGLPRAPTGAFEVVPGHAPPDRLSWPMTAEPGGAWLFGGVTRALDGTTPILLGDLWRWNAARQRWTRELVPAPPSPRAGHALVWEPHHGVLVVHGGFTTTSDEGPLGPDGPPVGTMFVFDPTTRVWSVVADASGSDAAWLKRRFHALMATGDGRLLMHGGLVAGVGARGDEETVGPVEVMGELMRGADGWAIDWDLAASATTARADWRFGHAAAIAGTERVVIGGRTFGGELASAIAVGSGGTWRALLSGPSEPVAGDFPTVVARPNGFVIATESTSWRMGSNPPALVVINAPDGQPLGRSGVGYVDASGSVHLLEGATSSGEAGRRAFELAADGWLAPRPWDAPQPRVGAALVGSDDGRHLYLLGGTRRVAAGPLQDAWEWRRDERAWVALVPASPPRATNDTTIDATRPAVADASTVWDAGRGRALIYGGVGPAGPTNAMWAFDGARYQALAVSGEAPPLGARALLASPEWLVVSAGSGAEGPRLWHVKAGADALGWERASAAPAVAGELVAAGREGGAGESERILTIVSGPATTTILTWDPTTELWEAPRGVALPGLGSDGRAAWDAEHGLVFVAETEGVVTIDTTLAIARRVEVKGAMAPLRPALAFLPSPGALIGFGGVHTGSTSAGPASARTFLYALGCWDAE